VSTKLRPRLVPDGTDASRMLCGRQRCGGELPRMVIERPSEAIAAGRRSLLTKFDLEGWQFISGAFERSKGAWSGGRRRRRVLRVHGGIGGDQSTAAQQCRFRCPKCGQINELDAVLGPDAVLQSTQEIDGGTRAW
jgi:hypothetical protein